MEKIHIRFMKDLRNIEFGELFELIYTTAMSEKIDLPLITTVIERLEPHRKELLRMNNVKLTHPLTKLIQEQVNVRTEYLGCLRLSVDAKMLSHKPEERTAATRLKFWLSPYKDYIYSKTIHRQSRMVEDLISDMNLSKEIKQATTLLDLDELIEAIDKINAKIRRNYLKRLNQKEIYNVDGLAIRDAAYMDLKVLVNALETSYNISTDDIQKKQIVQISSTINENMKDFRTLLRSRTTKKKNKKDVESAVKELIDDSSQVISGEIDTNDLILKTEFQLNPPSNSKTKTLSDPSSNNVNNVSEEDYKNKDRKDA